MVQKAIKKEVDYQPCGAGSTHPPPATPHRLQNQKWPLAGPKWPTGSGKLHSPPRFLGTPVNFSLMRFLIRALLYEKSRRRRNKTREKKMLFIVATNVVASRPPEQRPTGTPHTRSKNVQNRQNIQFCK